MDRLDGVPGRFGVSQFAGADLGDERRTKRLIRLADQLMAHPDGTLPDKIADLYQLDAAYRLFAEPDVTHAAVLAPHAARVRGAMTAAGQVVLLPHDTTELDDTTLDIPDLGALASRWSRGILCHNTPAVTVGGEVLGLAHQALLCAHPRPAKDTKSKARTDPDKISALWRNSVAAVGPTPPGCRWIHLADRGADVTELLDDAAEHSREYVVRAKHDRTVEVDGPDGVRTGRLFEYARSFPAAATRTPDVTHQARRPARTATVAVAWRRVRVVPPRQARGRERGVPLTVWVVRVWEPNPPAGATPPEWSPLTNVAVERVADAWERADWYARRWAIEECHERQKTGVGLGRLERTTAPRLANAIAVLSVVAVGLPVLRDAARRDDAGAMPAAARVPRRWADLLSRWRYGEARDLTVREWILALGRLGGRQNAPTDGLPGWQILWKGWGKLLTMLEGCRILNQ